MHSNPGKPLSVFLFGWQLSSMFFCDDDDLSRTTSCIIRMKSEVGQTAQVRIYQHDGSGNVGGPGVCNGNCEGIG